MAIEIVANMVIQTTQHGEHTNIAMENGPVEIVDFPMNSMVDLSMATC